MFFNLINHLKDILCAHIKIEVEKKNYWVNFFNKVLIWSIFFYKRLSVSHSHSYSKNLTDCIHYMEQWCRQIVYWSILHWQVNSVLTYQHKFSTGHTWLRSINKQPLLMLYSLYQYIYFSQYWRYILCKAR